MAAHGHSTDSPHREGYDFAHPMPVWVLLTVFFVLTLLTIITVAQASFDVGNLDIVLVMGIATIKAALVMLFFMHLAYDKPFNVIVFLASFVFVALFVILTINDVRQNAGTLEPVYDEPPPVVSGS